MSNATPTPAPALASAGTGRVLDYASGQAFLPAIGSVIRTDAPEWQAAATAGNVKPGLYRVARHVISDAPHKTTGKVSRNAGKDTVRLTPVAGSVAEAREALAVAEAALTRAEARVAEARTDLARAEATPAPAPVAVATPAPAAPVAEAPDLAAMIAAAVAQAMAGLKA